MMVDSTLEHAADLVVTDTEAPRPQHCLADIVIEQPMVQAINAQLGQLGKAIIFFHGDSRT